MTGELRIPAHITRIDDLVTSRNRGPAIRIVRSAQHYYDDARSAAHDAENVELVTYVLCTMSHLATWQGKPRVGIDHAVAAAVWADQAHSPLARDKSLTMTDPANLHNYTFDLLFRAEARIQQAEVDEASSIVADVARLTSVNSSPRITQRITERACLTGTLGAD